MQTDEIFTRFLKALGVRHTAAYSNAQFRGMTFKSLYGLSHLLTLYGIPNRGIKVADKSELTAIDTPFLAQTRQGVFVIVTAIDTKNPTVTYDSRGTIQTVGLDLFAEAWNGIALLAFPTDTSAEPGYVTNRLSELFNSFSGYVMACAALVALAYFTFTRGVLTHVSTALIALLDMAGLYLSFMLIQKTLDIHTAATDRVCSMLEHGGCDSIMETKASKLFGVLPWSVVGFGYFGVSLATLLMFPHLWPALALCNVCCLPYTFWSIWYQRFRARHWCTLCVGVQATLWLLFFCYLGGGWLGRSLPLHTDLAVLVAVYVFAVLALNLVVTAVSRLLHKK